MKKIIAVAVGILLTGIITDFASAAVSLNGDARSRWTYHHYSDGTEATDKDEKWSSRIRLNFNAEAKGGAYAKARLRLSDAKWDGTRQTRNKGAGSNLYTDYAYIGVPIGPVTIEGGLMNVNLTLFTAWDEREDMLAISWSNTLTSLDFWYIKSAEYTNNASDTIDDEDINKMALILDQKFSDKFTMKAAVFYTEDQTPADQSGFTGLIHAAGPAGPISLEGEFIYTENDVQGTTDDGLAGYLIGKTNFDSVSLTLNGGFTKDGYIADDDFGFLMMGGDTAITTDVTRNIGSIGDTVWAGTVIGFKVSDRLDIKTILAYADVDDFGSMVEISASLKYSISDGANLEWLVGLVTIDDDSDTVEDPMATGLTLNVSF